MGFMGKHYKGKGKFPSIAKGRINLWKQPTIEREIKCYNIFLSPL